MQTSELAKQCEVDMYYYGGPESDGSTLPEFFGDMQALKLMSSFRAFVRHIGGASEDTDFEYLQMSNVAGQVPRPCAKTPDIWRGYPQIFPAWWKMPLPIQ